MAFLTYPAAVHTIAWMDDGWLKVRQPERTDMLWKSIQDNTEHLRNLPEQLDLFVDGSCLAPKTPCLRLATWGVTVALLPDNSFQPIAAGGVVGLYTKPFWGLRSLAQFQRSVLLSSRQNCFAFGLIIHALVHRRVVLFAMDSTPFVTGRMIMTYGRPFLPLSDKRNVEGFSRGSL